jgi:hypothetical protein
MYRREPWCERRSQFLHQYARFSDERLAHPDRVAVLGVDDQSLFLDVAREVVAATPSFDWVAGRHPVPKRLTP